MKRLRNTNVNSPEYTDSKFQPIDKENLLRQEKYLSYIGSNGKKVVELGCGASYFPQMASKFNKSFGVDYAKGTIERMAIEFPNVQYIHADATKTPFTNEFFDVVVSGEVIEHIENTEDLVKEMVRICKPGGKMILSTPHLEFDDPEHIWEFEEKDLHDFFDKYGPVTTEVLKSEKFPGREYIFMVCRKQTKLLS